jgi:hypothetical protein
MNSQTVQTWLNRVPAQADSVERSNAALKLGLAFVRLQARVAERPEQAEPLHAIQTIIERIIEINPSRRGPYRPRAVRFQYGTTTHQNQSQASHE